MKGPYQITKAKFGDAEYCRFQFLLINTETDETICFRESNVPIPPSDMLAIQARLNTKALLG